MTQHELTVYKCVFCRKHYLVKHACEWHEKHCPKNPNNWHACFTCPQLSREENFDDGHREVTFTCLVSEKMMHSYIAERRRHKCLGDTERMPLWCADHPDATMEAKKIAAALKGITSSGQTTDMDEIFKLS